MKDAFKKALAAQGKKQQTATEKKFFDSLVRVHRAGEGAPFTGLKPAGEVEPVIAEADKALAGGSPDGLVKMVADTVNQGILTVFYFAIPCLKGVEIYRPTRAKLGFWIMCSAMMLMGLTFGIVGVLQSYLERVLGMG